MKTIGFIKHINMFLIQINNRLDELLSSSSAFKNYKQTDIHSTSLLEKLLCILYLLTAGGLDKIYELLMLIYLQNKNNNTPSGSTL